MLEGVHYEEHEPGPAQRGRLRFWRLSAPTPRAMEAEPVLPDGCVEVIVHLGDPFLLRSGAPEARPEIQPLLLCAGPGTSPVHLEPSGRAEVVGVRLEAGAACAFLAEPIASLVDRIVPLDAIAPELARGLAEELSEPRRGEDWRAVLERRLASQEARRALGRDARSEWTARAVQRLRGSGGRLPIDALARKSGLSSRQLERAFQRHVGLGPKLLARVFRFQRAFALLERPHLDLASIALRCGYYDQAHLVRDFRQFAGTSPGRLRAEAPELARHFADRRA